MTKLSKPSEVRKFNYDSTNYKDFFDQPYARSYAAGWWKDIDTGVEHVLDDESICAKEVLIMTELAEAVEGDRKSLMDDKLPHRKMVEVELADAVIRMLDLTYAQGITLDSIDFGKVPNRCFGDDVSFTKMIHNTCVGLFAEVSPIGKCIFLTHMLICWGNQNGYDVITAMYEKMEFNANRADHKLENRKTENGKSY